ncbi:MAG: Transposase DNA-binding [Glomeribacter sp. 1016415]|nr:Transposase DNA-binding [Glomeribacter sp. 1016415]
MLKKAKGVSGVTSEAQAWPEEEIVQSRFRDEHLTKRFRLVLERLWSCMGQSIPTAFQHWCSTKAAYRFLSNPKVSEQEILGGHFEATRKRFGASKGWC